MARREKDNYGTEPGLARWAVARAMKLAYLPNDPTMIEPCCGNGAPFAVAAKDMGLEPYGFDIRAVEPEVWDGHEGDGHCLAGMDISQFKTPRLFDIVGTNPPFNIGEQVVRKSLDMLAPFGAAVFLTKVAFLGTQERSKLYMERPPAEVWLLRSRPSFTGDGQTDIAQEYCFTFWRGHGADQALAEMGARQTHLHWLTNAGMMTSKKKKRVQIKKGDGRE